MMSRSIEQILAVFSRTERPPFGSIIDGNSIEAQAVGQYFEGKAWEDLSVERLHAEYSGDAASCLSFMTPSAFRYFFPAYMKMAFVQYESADAIFDVVLNKLHIAATESDSEIRKIFDGFDLKKKQAIADFLELLSEHICKFYPNNVAEEALNLYWRDYLLKRM